MSEIFIARPGVLRNQDKAALRKAGIVVVEANHEDVKFIRSTMEVHGDAMLQAAIEALNSQSGTTSGGYATPAAHQREKFMQLLTGLVKAAKP